MNNKWNQMLTNIILKVRSAWTKGDRTKKLIVLSGLVAIVASLWSFLRRSKIHLLMKVYKRTCTHVASSGIFFTNTNDHLNIPFASSTKTASLNWIGSHVYNPEFYVFLEFFSEVGFEKCSAMELPTIWTPRLSHLITFALLEWNTGIYEVF